MNGQSVSISVEDYNKSLELISTSRITIQDSLENVQSLEKTLSDEIQNASEQIDSLKDLKLSFENQKADFNNRKAELEKQKANLEREIHSLESQIELNGTGSDKLSGLQDSLSSIEREIASVDNLISMCKRVLEVIKNSILKFENYRSSLNQCLEKNKEYERQYNELSGRLDDVEERFVEAYELLQDYSKQDTDSFRRITPLASLSLGDYSYDINNYPSGDTFDSKLARGVVVARYLMLHGGFTAEQAAALAGVYIDENGCDPGSYNHAEANGYGSVYASNGGYGAGIGSWTNTDYKNKCLITAGFSPNISIQSLSMQQQCDMIIAVSQGKDEKTYYDALKRCDTIEDASATAVCIVGGVGFSKNWGTHPTPAEAHSLSDYYGEANDATYGESEYHWNLDVRRLDYAKKVLDVLNQ